MFKVAPLHSSLMLISMFGFIMSAFFLTQPVLATWAFAFLIVFVLIFISTIISMSKLPIHGEDSLSDLAIHKKKRRKK
ncbi:hypothetical protein CMO90_02455 [Candidatus Woesearchaeota archaeon]|jgi:membrane protein YdbS with pleckstrin-like domain|nr:hypothetical protein [Candidatus Woesearchaeota archaeon]|tara:strand:- start:62 stop:295 length:234 start_codon:yes stop_codon:yes gene_type:complete